MKGKSKGFTLIELLISITLLTLLMATGSYVYLQFASRWDKDLGRFEQAAETTRLAYQLKSLGDGIIPYIIHNGKDLKMFFVGKENSLLAVSRNGLLTGKSEIFRITVMDNKNGGKELVYQSVPLSEIVLTSAEQEVTFSSTITLTDKLSNIAINYYGWESLEKKLNENPSVTEEWRKSYNSLESEILPSRIVFDLNTVTNESVISVYITLEQGGETWYRHFLEASI